jgi:hypothetical protein
MEYGKRRNGAGISLQQKACGIVVGADCPLKIQWLLESSSHSFWEWVLSP